MANGKLKASYIETDGTVELSNTDKNTKLLLEDKLNFKDGDNTYKVWHEGNDGDGSGLDADLVKGTNKTICTAWVNFDGTDGTIRDSYNVSSVTHDDTGKYTITFENEMANANYVVAGSAGKADGRIINTNEADDNGHQTNKVGIIVTDYDGNEEDDDQVNIMIFGGK